MSPKYKSSENCSELNGVSMPKKPPACLLTKYKKFQKYSRTVCPQKKMGVILITVLCPAHVCLWTSSVQHHVSFVYKIFSFYTEFM